MSTPNQADIKDDTLKPSVSKNKTKQIRFGIIGCTETASTISRTIISLEPNDAIIVAVGSHSYDSAVQFISANQLPVGTIALGSYDAVISLSTVDAVFVSFLPMRTYLAVAAAKKRKHVLLETPTAPCFEQLAQVLKACKDKRVQFMDSTMWLHDSGTKKMKDIVRDNSLFGKLKMVHSICTSNEDYNVLRHAVWYCISVILWVNSYELPKFVRSLYSNKNASGILMSCGALLLWDNQTRQTATLHCSYEADLNRQTTVIGEKGTLEISVEPYGEGTTRPQRVSDANFTHLEWHNGTPTPIIPDTVGRITEPKEVNMVKKFVRLVRSIKTQGDEPTMKWHDISRKTQLIIDAVLKSVDANGDLVEIMPLEYSIDQNQGL